MTGAHVLVTRPEPGASETAARLRGLGFDPVLSPMLTIEPLSCALPAASGLQAVLVTSANAVANLPQHLVALPLFAVGAATAARAKARGFAHVESADADAAALARLAAARCRPDGNPVLLAHGLGQGDALHAALTEAGLPVIRAALYATHPVVSLPPAAASCWRDGLIAASLFFSAETARAFVRAAVAGGVAEAARHSAALAIGAPAASALAPLPWRQVRVAVRPDQESLLALLT